MASSSFKISEYPIPQTELGKDLAPYLQAILKAQAAILQQLEYSVDREGDPSSRDDIEEQLLGFVNLAHLRANRK